MTDTAGLMHILQICDSLFPVGAFTLSNGLETYVQHDIITSPKGLEHRSKRPVEVEAVFGQIKWNKEYKRFRHKGLEKIVMDFGILAIAFNRKNDLQAEKG